MENLFKLINNWLEEKCSNSDGKIATYVWLMLYFVWRVFYELVIWYGLIVIVVMICMKFVKQDELE